jgi:hypothetical protein
MSDSTPHSQDALDSASREEILAALFANMVIQQTNMAMMLMGKAPHPETGQTIKDLESARMFIDQLEMLEAKTKGNLNKQEEGLLKQALAAVHMTFVEAMDEESGAGRKPSQGATESAQKSSPAPETKSPAAPPPVEAPSAGADESRKKFSKKY